MKLFNWIICIALAQVAMIPAASANDNQVVDGNKCGVEFNKCQRKCFNDLLGAIGPFCIQQGGCKVTAKPPADPKQDQSQMQWSCGQSTRECNECIQNCTDYHQQCETAYNAVKGNNDSAKAAGKEAQTLAGEATQINRKNDSEFTKNFAMGTQVLNTVGTLTTNATTTVMGAQAQTKALSNSSQSEMMKDSAKMTKITGISQLSLGTINAAAGGYLISRGLKHDKAADLLADYQDEAQALKEKAAEKRQEASDAAASGKSAEARKLASEASKYESQAAKATREIGRMQGKQQAAASTGQSQGMVAMTVGLRDMITGAANIAAANMMKKAANNLRSTTGGIAAPGISVGADPLAPKDGMVISGTGEDPAASGVTAEEEESKDKDDLGTPLGNLPPNTTPDAPPAGDFIAKDFSPGNGGAGAGGTNTSPSTGGGEEGAAKSAAGSQGSYEASGGGSSSGNGNGRAGMNDKGIDLASMLGQLLPKPEDEQKKNDILAFGNRAPAADDSILGRDSKSLFERVAEATQAKYKTGSIK